MPSYSAIADGDIDAESPITVGLMTKLRDNPIAAHAFAARTTDGTDKSNSTALASDAVLTFTAAASTVYEVTIRGGFTYTEQYGVKFAVDAPAGATVYASYSLVAPADPAVAVMAIGGSATGIATAMSSRPTADATNHTGAALAVTALIQTGATAGAVALQYAQHTAGVATTQILAGAYLVAHRVTAL